MTPHSPSTPRPAETFQQLVGRAVSEFAHLPALSDSAGATISYRDLGAIIDAFRADLRTLGIGPQDQVVLPLPQSINGAILLIALQAAAIAVPVHPAAPGPELEAFLGRLTPRAVLLPHPSVSLAGVAAKLDIPAITVRFPRSRYRAILDGFRPGPPAIDRDARPADHALILHTSGTTGRPKIVPLTQRNIADMPPLVAPRLPVHPGDVTILGLPLLHGFAQSALSRSLAGGGCAVLPGTAPDVISVHLLTGLARQHHPAWMPMTPVLVDRWTRLESADAPISGGALRYLHVAGAVLAPSVRMRAEARLDAPILQSYGASEALAVSYQSFSSPSAPDDCGAPVIDVRIVDDAGHAVPEAMPGLLLVSGPAVFPGYLDDPAANARAFTTDGWFRMGDRAILRADGNLAILGRVDDVINRGGDKIDPVEVENVLLSHPEVAAAAVFALPDPEFGQAPAAIVVAADGASPAPRVLRRWLLDHLLAFKVPRSIVLADALPVTPTGKIRRAALPDLFAALAGQDRDVTRD